MAVQSDEARSLAKERRWQSQRLAQQVYSLEGGSGSIELLGGLSARSDVALSTRLRAIDAAIARGMVTREEIRNPGPEPQLSAFGLQSPEEPSRIPPTLRRFAERYPMRLCAGTSFLVISGYMFANTGSIQGALAIAALGTFFGGFGVVMVIVMIAVGLIDRRAPGRAEWRAWKAATSRHTALIAARGVLMLENDVRAFTTASGPEFERLTARALRRHGYRVEEMGGANDGGVDLLVWKGNLHAIVQCKAHAKPMGPAVVRELLGALNHHRKATMAILVTTNGVTENAREWCKGKPIKLLQSDHLINGWS